MKRPALLYLLFSGVMGVFILLAVLTAIVQVSAPIVSSQPVEQGDVEEIVAPLATEDLLKQHADLFSRVVRLEPVGAGSVFEVHAPEEVHYDGGGSTTLVELWYLSETQEVRKFHEFSLPSDCASFDWKIEGELLHVTEMTSPCEAFANYNESYYGLPSTQRYVGLKWSEPGGEIEYTQYEQTKKIRLVTDAEACAETVARDPWPQTLLTGLNITDEATGETTFVPLEESVRVDCEVLYGDMITVPGIMSPEFNNSSYQTISSIQFKIPSHYPGDPIPATLFFPYKAFQFIVGEPEPQFD